MRGLFVSLVQLHYKVVIEQNRHFGCPGTVLLLAYTVRRPGQVYHRIKEGFRVLLMQIRKLYLRQICFAFSD